MDQIFNIAKVFGRHCDNFGKQCFAEMQKPVNCKIQALIVCQKLFHIKTFFNKLSNQLHRLEWYEGDKNDCMRNINRIALKMEALEIEFAKMQSNKAVEIVKRIKVLAFLAQVNMSTADTVFLKYYVQLCAMDNIPKPAKRLFQMKRKMIGIFQNKDNWTKPYLRQVKRYKLTEHVISESINFLKRRDYD